MLNKYYQPGCDTESLEIRYKIKTFKKIYGERFEAGKYVGSKHRARGKMYVVAFVRFNYFNEPHKAEVRLMKLKAWKRMHTISSPPKHINCRCVIEG